MIFINMCLWGMGKVLEAQEEIGKPILWGMGWVNRRLGIFGGHPICHKIVKIFTFLILTPCEHVPQVNVGIPHCGGVDKHQR